MKAIVLIQSRFSSSRLPGKSLLPVASIPSVILCARRAANTGLYTKIISSTDSSDDTLCEAVKAERIPHFRGELNNVLKRFYDAIHGESDRSVVVRLTADNLFVDGALIEETVAAFHEQDKEYISLHPSLITGTPYGLSVEVFTAEALRVAYSEAIDNFDLEHVTPLIIRKFGLSTYIPKDLKPGQGHLRCTMDTWSDYQQLLEIFRRVPDPVNAKWQDLCDHLQLVGPKQGIPGSFSNKGHIAELALGTAQLGLPYGIANSSGQPSVEEAKRLVHQAIAHGVTHLDCAAGYGEAESLLGQVLRDGYQSRVTVVSKLSPLSHLADNANDKEIQAHVEASVYKSCVNLNMPFLPYLLLHRWSHRTSHGGRIWGVVKQLQKEGVVIKLGVSAQNPEEAMEAFADPDIQFIQLPFNLLDRRLQQSGFIERVKYRNDVIIQARSVLLQGLLILPAKKWPEISGISPTKIINQLSGFTRKFNRRSVADLCVSYVRSQNWIDCLVVGMENIEQLNQNVSFFQNSPLSIDECAEIESAFSNLPDKLLNPALWPSIGGN